MTIVLIVRHRKSLSFYSEHSFKEERNDTFDWSINWIKTDDSISMRKYFKHFNRFFSNWKIDLKRCRFGDVIWKIDPFISMKKTLKNQMIQVEFN